MKNHIISALLLFVGVFVAGFFIVYAQTFSVITLDNPTPQAGALFGAPIKFIHDISNDGIADIAVCALFGGAGGSGRAFIFSGKDQGLLLVLNNPIPKFHDFFCSDISSIDDINNDGIPDIIIGAFGDQTPSNGRVYAFSGADGSVIHVIPNPFADPTGASFGLALTPIDDFDNDGVEDILVASLTQDVTLVNEGQLFAFSGATGNLLSVINNPQPETNSGWGGGPKRIGDINNDGVKDVFIGAHERDAGGMHDAGQAYIYSGKDFSILRIFISPVPVAFGNFGDGGVDLGDVNGDNVPDLAINESKTGKHYVFSGQTGLLIYSIAGAGRIIASAGDFNGDGVVDLLSGDPIAASGAGQIFVFNGVDGTLLFTFENPTAQFNVSFANAITDGLDVNNDSIPDILAGVPGQDIGGNENQGQVYLFFSEREEIDVGVDIKPGGFPNSINRNHKGNIPVAVFSSEDFDSTEIDLTTVEFAGAAALDIGKGYKDVDGDSLLDVVFHFLVKDTEIPDGSIEECLTGETFGGVKFKGCDSVRLIK